MKLPTGWAATTLRKLGGTVGGKTPSKAVSGYWTGGTIPWVSPKDMKIFKIAGSEDKITHQALIGGSMNLLPTDSVLMVTRSGILAHTFPVAITGCAVTINQDIKAVRPSSAFNSKWLAYSLRAQSATILGECTKAGTTVASVEMEALESLPIPMPPLPEQTRIADKLDTVLTRVDACRDRLARVAPLLKRFRQSVLAAATSGRLTEDWRVQHGEHLDGAQLVSALQNDHAAVGGHSRGNASEPTEDAHDLSQADLPIKWAIAELRDICEPGRPITYGILKPGPELAEGVPYIRVADFPGNKLRLDSIKKTSADIDEQFKRARLRAGDLLLSIRGSVGRLIEIPSVLENANITQDTARLSISSRLNSRYVYHVLLAETTQRRMQNAVRGVAVRGINIGDVRALQVPVAPIEEQTEIVRRVETLFAFADRLEARLKTAQTAADRLTPALLAKAFRGELVPPDPNDEPAAELLKRLAASRDVAPKAKRGRRSATADTTP